MNGGTGTRPNAPFVGKVPTTAAPREGVFEATGTPIETPFSAGRGIAIGRVKQLPTGDEMPDYAADPVLWDKLMKRRMAGALKARNIINFMNQEQIIKPALETTAARRPGDVNYAFGQMSRELRGWKRARVKWEAAEAEKKAARADWRYDANEALRRLAISANAGSDFILALFGGLIANAPADRALAVTMIADAQRADGLRLADYFEGLTNEGTTTMVSATAEKPAEKSEIDEALHRSSITTTDASRRSFFAQVDKTEKRYSLSSDLKLDIDDYRHKALGVKSLDDWPDGKTLDDAVQQHYMYTIDTYPNSDRTKEDIKDLFVRAGMGLDSFYPATQSPNYAEALKRGNDPSDVILMIQSYIAERKRAEAAKPVGVGDDSAEAPERQSKPVEAPKPVATHPDIVPATAKQGQAFLTVEKAIVETSDKTEKRDEIRRKYNMKQRGNDYLMVQGRVLLMRLDHPEWAIETDTVMLTETIAVFKATVRNDEGHIVATGHGRATEAGTKNLGGRYIEKAETAAIGRALALSGYGTDDTLEDGDYLADSPVTKAA